MNLQEILAPIGDIIVWTFDNILVPMGNLPNLLVVILLFFGLMTWIKMQKKYNEEAERTGGLK